MSNASIYAGLTAQAQALVDRVYSLFGASNVTLTSGARSVGANSGIAGASRTSQHLTGNAFDFQVSGYDPKDVQALIAGSGISYGQSIAEYGAGMNPRNHLGVGTKGQNLVGTNGQYTPIVVSPVSANAGTWGDQIAATFGVEAGNVSDAVGRALSAPGNALDGAVKSVAPDLNSWFMRISVGALALVFIAAALFALKGGDVIQSVKGAAL